MAPARKDNQKYAGTHFSEEVAKRLGTNLVVLSNGGCSNFSIALQVEAAINWSPTPALILVGNVPFDRIELPLQDEIIAPTIFDQIYHLPQFFSYHRTDNPKFISTALRDFFDNDHMNNWIKEFPDIKKFVNPIHEYFNFIYNHNLKRKMDEQIIYSFYHKLHSSKIPYFICIEIFKDVKNYCPWLINEKGDVQFPYLSEKISNMITEPKSDDIDGGDSPFHLSTKDQKLIAELIIKTYEENINKW